MRFLGAFRRRLTSAEHSRRYRRRWTPANETEAMDVILNETDEETFEASGRWEAEEVLGPMIRATDTVVDFGCGIGRVTRYVAPLCREVWAVDISPTMLDLARARLANLKNVRFVQSDGVTLDQPPSGTADFLYALLTLQHVEREDAFALLREFRRVLRPNGLLYVTFPNLLSDVYLRGFVHYVDTGEVRNPARARMYTPEEVRRIVPAAAFEIEKLDVDDEIRVTARAA